MFVIEKMKLNKFEPRPIQSNREIALCKGESAPLIQSKDTAECFSEPSIIGASKTKMLGLAQDISNKAIAHAKAEETSKLNKSTADL